MTVSTTLREAVFSTNGATTVFPYSFKVVEEDHLIVQLLNATTEAVEKTYTASEYSVSGIGTNSGSVTISPAPATGKKLRVRRVVPLTQNTDIINQGGFFPSVIEDQLDLTTMQIQQVDEELDDLSAEVSSVITFAGALSSPIYTSIAEGLAATKSGEEFLVDEQDGTGTVYLNISGAQSPRRNIILDPANSSAAGLLGSLNGTVQADLTAALGHGTTVFAVADLPAANSVSGAFRRAFVTDSNVAASSNFGSIVAGGGSNVVPVYSDGTNWRIG